MVSPPTFLEHSGVAVQPGPQPFRPIGPAAIGYHWDYPLGMHLHRREFLSLAAGALPIARHTAFAATPRNLRKAIMYDTIKMKGTVLEKFQAVKAAGFAGVEPM